MESQNEKNCYREVAGVDVSISYGLFHSDRQQLPWVSRKGRQVNAACLQKEQGNNEHRLGVMKARRGK